MNISIVIPCYNCKQTIERCLNSIKKQIYTDIEIILVDDGSIDGTSEYCDMAKLYDARIKVLHKKNGGLVSAWKAGVSIASGDYIVFCDSDDYIDSELTQRLSDVIIKYTPDLIIYGMVFEYLNKTVKRPNNLSGGYYDKSDIEKKILPNFFSNGQMESELVMNSRCTKAFSKTLLKEIMDDVPNDITHGEDAVTTFATMMKVTSIYCIGNYFPYHYVRNSGSMIGAYDAFVFDKLDKKYQAIRKIAYKEKYMNESQISSAQFSSMILYMKKEMSLNPNGYKDIKSKIKNVETIESFKKCIESTSIREYKLSAKCFAFLVIHHYYFLAYLSVKLLDKIAGKALNK